MRALLRNQDFRAVLGGLAGVAVFHSISAWTGFGAWVDTNPGARGGMHLFGVLLFGALGLVALLGGRYEPAMRTTSYRLSGVLLLLFAAVHVVLLFGLSPWLAARLSGGAA